MPLVKNRREAELPEKYSNLIKYSLIILACLTMLSHGYCVDVESVGAVYAVARQSDGKTLLGGNFTLIKGNPCRYLARLNTDGTPDESWTRNAQADAPVHAIAVGHDGIYVGGAFSNLAGSASLHLGKLSIAAGTPVSEFAPPALDGAVTRLVLDGSQLYVMGDFTQVGVTARRYIARLSADAAAFDSGWNPAPNGPVYGVVPDIDNNLVYLGGNFTYMGSPAAPAQFLRRCAAAPGALDTSWQPNYE